MGHYRQWQLPGEGSPFTKEGIIKQVRRLDQFKDSVEKLSREASNLVIMGDTNIDQLPENLPLDRPEIRALQPILERMMTKHDLKRMNSKPTRFFNSQKPSLLDLILSNEPQSISEVQNIKTGLADHDGVSCTLNCRGLVSRPQFHIARNYDMLNAANIMEMIDKDYEIQSIFGETDPNPIANKLNEGLNRIALKLVKKTKIQNNKHNSKFYDQ